MKSLKYLLLIVSALLILPFSVFADDEEATEATESKEVNIYLFRGEGCPHCQEAEEWFDSIEEEYGSYYNIVDYETWYNEDNAELMEKVAEARGEEAQGVPYIIIGDKSWNGFAEDYEEEMLSQIKKVFAQDVNERYDVMKYLTTGEKKEEKGSSDVLALILILLVVGGIGFGIYKAREKTN